MINQELVKYIEVQLKRGLSWDEIKDILLSNGWTEDVIEENYKEVSKSIQPPEAIKPVETPTVIAQPIEPQNIAKPVETMQMQEKEINPIQEAPQEYKISEPITPKETVINVMPKEEIKEEVKMENLMPAEPVGFEEPKPRNTKKLMMILGIAIGALVLIGGGAAFAYYQFVFPQKVFYDVISNAAANIDMIANQSTVSFKADAELKQEALDMLSLDPSYKFISLSLNNQASVDLSGETALKALWSGTIALNSKPDAQSQDSKQISLSAEIRTDNNVVYGAITDLQGLESLPLEKSLADEYQQYFTTNIKNQWVKFDLPVDSQGQSYYSEYKKEYNDQIQKNIENYNTFNPQIKKALKIKVMGSEKIEGDDCYHYQLTFDQQELWNLLKSVTQNSATEAISDTQWQTYQNDYNNIIWPSLQKANIELWATKKNSYIRKYQLTYNDNFANVSEVQISTISITSTGTVKKLTPGSVVVDVPQNTKDAMELLFSSYVNANKDYVIKADMLTFMDGISQYYATNKSYSGFISRSTGKDIIAHMDALGGGSTIAYTSKAKYCLAKELLSGEGSWCIDSTGFIGISSNCKKETYSCK